MKAPVDLFEPAHYEAVRKPAQSASPLPNWCYTSDAFFQAEVERIFMKAWNYVAHASQLPKPGDFLTREIAGVPIILIRGEDEQIRAFYNSCRHRGSKIVAGDGHCSRLTCPYHMWSYGLDGRLNATPLIDEDDHLRHSELALLSVRLEQWAGFQFVCFDASADPLEAWLGDLRANCAGYEPESMICTRRITYQVAANWKLHFENFNDSLHIPFVHGGTLNRQKVSKRARRTHEEFNGECIVHFTSHSGSRGLLHGESGFDPIPTLEGRYREGTYYPCILPATMMAWTIDCMFLFELMPRSASSVEVGICSFFPAACMARPDFEEIAKRYYHRLDVILPEDNQAVEVQQTGLQVPVQAASRFTHMETLCHAFDNWIVNRIVD